MTKHLILNDKVYVFKTTYGEQLFLPLCWFCTCTREEEEETCGKQENLNNKI